MVTFLDDVNMPVKDAFGSQPPIELLMMWMDYAFWYNRKDQTKVNVIDTVLMAAMGPPGGGRQVFGEVSLSQFFRLSFYRCLNNGNVGENVICCVLQFCLFSFAS